MKKAIALCIIGASLFLSACGQVRTQVTRFHDIPSAPLGSTFFVLPFEAQTASLEWREYSRGISQRLSGIGLREVSRFDDADFIVTFQYAIDRGTTTTRAVPIFGQTGGGQSTTTATMFGPRGFGTYTGQTTTPPTFGVTGHASRTETSFLRELAVDIIDRKQSTPERIVKRFEARAQSSGESSSLNEIMPYLIEAVFKDFPGRSGETTTVTVPLRR